MTLIDTRHEQMFPVLSAAQTETAERFASGEPRRFAPGELMFNVGEWHAPLGSSSRDRSRCSVTMGGDRNCHHVERAGQFSGEVSQLAARRRWPPAAPGRRG